jgi:hypothetical protein
MYTVGTCKNVALHRPSTGPAPWGAVAICSLRCARIRRCLDPARVKMRSCDDLQDQLRGDVTEYALRAIARIPCLRAPGLAPYQFAGSGRTHRGDGKELAAGR